MEVQSQFIEMFGNAPKIKLEDYISTQSGGTPNTKKQEYYEGGDIPWLSSGEINQGYIESTEKFITQKGLENSSAKWVPKDCVVIAMYGATAGKVGYIRIPLTTNQAVCSLLPCSEFNSIFLYYAVSQKSDWMISQCRGAAQPNISQGIIRSMELLLPPMEEQMKFVTIAEQADKSKFVGFKSQFIEMFGDFYTSAESTLADYVNLKAGKSKKAELIRDSQKDAQYPCYGGNGIRGYVDDFTHNGTYCIIGRQGALCGNVQIAHGQFYATEHAVVVSPIVEINTTWLFFALTQMNLNQYARGVAQPGLAVNQIEKLSFSLPSLDGQNRFASIAEQADKSKFELRKSIEAIDAVIKSLINN